MDQRAVTADPAALIAETSDPAKGLGASAGVPPVTYTQVHFGHDAVTRVAEAGDGPALVFLQGWGIPLDTYAPAIAAIASLGWRVIAPGLAPFGGCTPLALGRTNLDGYADRVRDVLTEYGLDADLPVLGHSFGGGIAIRLTTRYPQLVRDLTLVCPVGGAEPPSILPAPSVLRGISKEATPSRMKEAMHGFLSAAVRAPWHVTLSGWNAWHADLVDEVAAIARRQIPVRFVFADNDDVLRPGALPHVPGTESYHVPGRHGWLVNEPDEFAGLVGRWLIPTPATP